MSSEKDTSILAASGQRLGRLISFEGPEGSGKSTQIERLRARLTAAGKPVVTTREPGGTTIGEEIRHLLKHHTSGEHMCAETEMLLFAASRAQLVREILSPCLSRGDIVICDRFLDSSTVYQGAARNLATEPVAAINSFAVGNYVPDLTIVIDLPAEESLRRIGKRNAGAPDRMERESIEFYRKVRDGYLVLAKSLPLRFRVIDGTLSMDEVESAIWSQVAPLVGA